MSLMQLPMLLFDKALIFSPMYCYWAYSCHTCNRLAFVGYSETVFLSARWCLSDWDPTAESEPCSGPTQYNG